MVGTKPATEVMTCAADGLGEASSRARSCLGPECLSLSLKEGVHCHYEECGLGGCGDPQQLRVLVAIPEDLGLNPSIGMVAPHCG